MNKITNEVLNNWKEEIGALNVEKGWRTEPRTIEDHCALLHSEVSEAFEDYRNNHAINEVWYDYPDGVGGYRSEKEKFYVLSDNNLLLGKPCGTPSELADVVIRALDMADEFEYYVVKKEVRALLGDSFTKEISLLHSICSNIYVNEELEELSYLISFTCEIAKKYGIDLYKEIDDKIAYNRTRPARHGGKKI